MRLSDAKIEGGRLSFSVSPSEARSFVYRFKPGEYDIVPSKQKRSKDANSYLWWLCTRIAEAVKSEKETVYLDAVKAVGIYKDFPPLPEADARTLRTSWAMLGTGWLTEQVDYDRDGERVIVRCYYGSSTYNTAQMSRLIDWLVEDARNLDIDVDTEQIKSLLESWEVKT